MSGYDFESIYIYIFLLVNHSNKKQSLIFENNKVSKIHKCKDKELPNCF